MKKKLWVPSLILFTFIASATLGQWANKTNAIYAAEEIKLYVLGNPLFINKPLYLNNEVTMAPLRVIAEQLGAAVVWEQASQTAIVTKSDIRIELPAGQSIANVNGSVVSLTSPSALIHDTFMAPVRFIGETLGYHVWWNNSSRTVHIEEAVHVLPTVDSFDQLKKLLNHYTTNQFMFLREFPIPSESVAAPATDSSTGAAEGKSASSQVSPVNGDFSRTNTQVAGVDEADVIKTDGTYIYQVNRNRILIVQALPSDQLKVVSQINYAADNTFSPQEMYVDDQHLVVIGTSYVLSAYLGQPMPTEPLLESFPSIGKPRPGGGIPYYPSYSTTKAIVYDISDKAAPKQIREVELQGNYISSRKIGSSLYLISNQWLDMYLLNEQPAAFAQPFYIDSEVSSAAVTIPFEQIHYFPEAVESSYTLIGAISLDSPQQEMKVASYLGSGQHIYASSEYLYVTIPQYLQDADQETMIYKFALTPDNIRLIARGEVPGRVLNQFSMDEYNGHFRIAITTGATWVNNQLTSKNHLYILDPQLKIAGQINNIAPGEQIYSVRFMGKRAYMVTFRTVDPLFVIDVADPKKPSILGELKIPGYSQYLHPYDENHIIGFGKDAAEVTMNQNGFQSTAVYNLGMKVSLFDVTDVTNPIEKFVESIGDRGTDSALLNNHKALLFAKDKNLLAFPVSLYEVKNNPYNEKYPYGQLTFQGAYVYHLDVMNGFKLRGRISHLPAEAISKADTIPPVERMAIADSGHYSYELNIERLLYIQNSLYTLSLGKMHVHDLTSLEQISFIDLPKPAEQHYPQYYSK